MAPELQEKGQLSEQVNRMFETNQCSSLLDTNQKTEVHVYVKVIIIKFSIIYKKQ